MLEVHRLSRLGTTRADGAASSTAAPALSEARLGEVLDRYLNDDYGQRVRMASVAGGAMAAAGVTASILPRVLSPALLTSTHAVAAATVLGTAAGIGIGLYCCKKFTDNQGRFITSYLLGAIGGFGALIAGAATNTAGLGAGLITALGVGLIGAMAGGAAREGQSRRAAQDLDRLEADLDRATELEGVVLRNAQNSQKAAQPGGQVQVQDDFIVVAGIRVPRGGHRS